MINGWQASHRVTPGSSRTGSRRPRSSSPWRNVLMPPPGLQMPILQGQPLGLAPQLAAAPGLVRSQSLPAQISRSGPSGGLHASLRHTLARPPSLPSAGSVAFTHSVGSTMPPPTFGCSAPPTPFSSSVASPAFGKAFAQSFTFPAVCSLNATSPSCGPLQESAKKSCTVLKDMEDALIEVENEIAKDVIFERSKRLTHDSGRTRNWYNDKCSRNDRNRAHSGSDISLNSLSGRTSLTCGREERKLAAMRDYLAEAKDSPTTRVPSAERQDWKPATWLCEAQRSRIWALEQEISDLRETSSAARERDAAEITSLREQLIHCQAQCESQQAIADQLQQLSHDSRTVNAETGELHQQLDSLQQAAAAEQAANKQELGELSARSSELFEELLEAQSQNTADREEHMEHVARIESLECALHKSEEFQAHQSAQFQVELQAASCSVEERHSAELVLAEQRLIETRDQLLNAESKDAGQQIRLSAQSQRIADLESELVRESSQRRLAEKSCGQLQDAHKAKAAELLHELDVLRETVSDYEQQKNSQRTRIADLEQRLVQRSSEFPVQLGLVQAHSVLESQEEKALQAKQKLHEQQEKHAIEWQASLRQANIQINSLEAKLQEALSELAGQPCSKMTTAQNEEQRDTTCKVDRREAVDPFVLKVQQAVKLLTESMQHGRHLRVKSIDTQLSVLSKISWDRSQLHESALNHSARQEIEVEQRKLCEALADGMQTLRSLQQEMPSQRHLTSEDLKAVKDLLDSAVDLDKCEHELRMLRSPASVADLPEHFIRELMEARAKDEVPGATIRNSYSLMHQAAQLGRRDIIEFLFDLDSQHPTQQQSADLQGLHPIDHVRCVHQPALDPCLSEEAMKRLSKDSLPPVRCFLASRPDVSMLPQQYLELLEQIELSGWDRVEWKHGYTLLHWAAKKGHADLCRYLVRLGAQINGVNDYGKTPLDVAKAAGQNQAADLLQEMQHAVAGAALQELAREPGLHV